MIVCSVIAFLWNIKRMFLHVVVGRWFRNRNNERSTCVKCNRIMGAISVDRHIIHDDANKINVYIDKYIFFLSIFSAQQSVQQEPHRKRPIATGAGVGGKKQQRNARTRRRGMVCVLACHT